MKKSIIFAICITVFFAMAFSGDYTYVGVKKCKICHKAKKRGEVYQKWEKRLHSKAFETLKDNGEERNPACLPCHVTAFNAGGYKIGDANASKFENVQCEVCHGPGSAYKKMTIMKDQKKALKNGLIVPTEELCKKCHNKKSPTFKGFNYKEALKKMNHVYRKK
ncbi:MAG: cytochrome C554 [bacterium]|nr:cytochrome C554 [bacterium]